MRLTTVYDNQTLDPDLASAWSFACLVGDDLLFDTGGDASRLLSNMERMGIDPAGIRTVVLSHAHGDHTGGLGGLLSTGARPTVYALRSFPQRFKADVRSLTTFVEVAGPVETAYGLIVITGCAHPGVVKMVRRAKESVGGGMAADVSIVIGGFHLGSASRRQIGRIIADFRDLRVRKVAPCHCTGDQAMQLFAKEYGSDFARVGVGRVITVGSEE